MIYVLNNLVFCKMSYDVRHIFLKSMKERYQVHNNKGVDIENAITFGNSIVK